MAGKRPPGQSDSSSDAADKKPTSTREATDFGSNAALQAQLGTWEGPGLVGPVPSVRDPLVAELAAKLRPYNGLFTEDEDGVAKVVDDFVATHSGLPMDVEELARVTAWVHRAVRGSGQRSATKLEGMLLVTPDSPAEGTAGIPASDIAEMATHFGTLVTVADLMLGKYTDQFPELQKPAVALRSSAMRTRAVLNFLGHSANIIGSGAALLDLREKYKALKAAEEQGPTAYAEAADNFNASLAGTVLALGLTGAALIWATPLVTTLGLINGVFTAINPNWLGSVLKGQDPGLLPEVSPLGNVITDQIEEHGQQTHLMDQYKESGQKLPWRN